MISLGTNEILGGGGFHHVSINAYDLNRSVSFYTDVLGFRKVMEFNSGNRSCIMLDSGDGACLELFSGGTPDEKAGWSELHIALRTADTRAVLERVRASGMKITMEPEDMVLPGDPPKPITIAFFKGPDGELVELFQER